VARCPASRRPSPLPSSAQIDAEAPSVTDPGYGGEHG
jgi:hypothetical protein